MTLINYLSRVHFADGVLEVALSSELELNQFSRPLLVSENNIVNSDFSERVIAGLPFRCEYSCFNVYSNNDLQATVSALEEQAIDVSSDVIIAFGSSFAVSVADACCRRLRSSKISYNNDHSVEPELFAIPGVDGLPALSAPRQDSGGKARWTIAAGIQPAAVIIDPTLIMGESIERTASAVAKTIARCLNAHFSNAYNPPADGIAMDGFSRIVRNLSDIVSQDTLEMRRELMAASLNGTLAMQKELSVAYSLYQILMKSLGAVDEGALMRILILGEAELIQRSKSVVHVAELRIVLGIPAGQDLREWLSLILQELPLPGSLGELGVSVSKIQRATSELVLYNSLLVPSAKQLADILIGIELQNHHLQPVSGFI